MSNTDPTNGMDSFELTQTLGRTPSIHSETRSLDVKDKHGSTAVCAFSAFMKVGLIGLIVDTGDSAIAFSKHLDSADNITRLWNYTWDDRQCWGLLPLPRRMRCS